MLSKPQVKRVEGKVLNSRVEVSLPPESEITRRLSS